MKETLTFENDFVGINQPIKECLKLIEQSINNKTFIEDRDLNE